MVFSCVVRNLLGLAGSAAFRRRKKASTGGGAQYRPRIVAIGASASCARNPESRSGKTWETFDHDRTPLMLRQQMGQLAQSSSVKRGCQRSRPWRLPGSGKNALCAMGHRLVEAGR